MKSRWVAITLCLAGCTTEGTVPVATPPGRDAAPAALKRDARPVPTEADGPVTAVDTDASVPENTADAASVDAAPIEAGRAADVAADPSRPPDEQLRTAALGPFHACAIDAASRLTCFGRGNPNDDGVDRAHPPRNWPEVVAVATHHVSNCTILKNPAAPDDAIRCFGVQGTLERPPRIAGPVFIASGNRHACALGAGGAVTCWGEAGHQPPAGLRAKQIAALRITCAIAQDDRVVCWGPEAPIPPADLRARSIAVGGDVDLSGPVRAHVCAVALDGRVVCWGRDNAATRVPADLRAREVATGGSASCAIRADDSVTCWGTLPGKPLPADLRAHHILMSNQAAMAVLSDGRWVFWGDERDGKSNPPDVRVAF